MPQPLPKAFEDKLANYHAVAGTSVLRSQLQLLAVALAISAVQWLLVGHASLLSTVIYTLAAGNVLTLTLSLFVPLLQRTWLQGWAGYCAVLVPVSVFAAVVAGVLNRLVLGRPLRTLEGWSGDIPYASLICFMIGVVTRAFVVKRVQLEEANALLAQQVQVGQSRLEAQAQELRDAFQIQASLLPTTIPQIAGVEISCAWQPARTVSGDYFDVLVQADTRVAFCLADVSGKGMAAALVTANLQASLRAFAPQEPGPGQLCRRLNAALCASLPTGRFVTMVYAVLDRAAMTLTYEVAGHNPPLLLRDGRVERLQGSGPVLGMLPAAEFRERTVPLRSGDLLLLTTDGVTEAFDAAEEEYGEERLVEAARAAEPNAQAVRAAVMESVTEFASGNFHDDASLLVVKIR